MVSYLKNKSKYGLIKFSPSLDHSVSTTFNNIVTLTRLINKEEVVLFPNLLIVSD